MTEIDTNADTPIEPLPPSEAGRRTRFARSLLRRLPAGAQRLLRGGWETWLHVLAWRWWIRDIVAPVTLLIIGRAIALPFQANLPEAVNQNIGLEIAYDLAVLFASVSFIRWSGTWGVPHMMASVRHIAHATQEPKREFLRQLATEQVRETRRIVEGLTQGSYTVQSPSALKPWFARFFANGGRTYIGVDSHRPAVFMSQYEWYLDAHAKNLLTRGSPDIDTRVLATPRTEITDDFRFSYAAYQDFYRWHQDNKVTINWIDWDSADRLRQDHHVGSVDVGLWENFAVLFSSAPGETAITLTMYFPGEPVRDGTTYEEIRNYVYEALAGSEDLNAVAPRLELVDRDLAVEWEAYVDPDSRASGPLGRFLKSTLRGQHYVFDAAAGIACDSVFLIKQGHQVYTNEVDGLLADLAEEYAHKEGVELQLSTHLWESLPGSLPGNFRFDAILCLGNSICLVEDEAGRLRCLEALRDTLLSDDSVLIIDERNFQYMLDRAKAIGADPISNYLPTVRGDEMYGGRAIRGYPAEIDRDLRVVKWRFFRNRPPVRTLGDIEEQRLKCRDLTLHAFHHGELHDLLRQVGFMQIRTYADLVDVTPAEGGMPDRAEVGDAHFITYVASRGASNTASVTDLPAGEPVASPVAPGA
jgi:hypothetical protein